MVHVVCDESRGLASGEPRRIVFGGAVLPVAAARALDVTDRSERRAHRARVVITGQQGMHEVAGGDHLLAPQASERLPHEARAFGSGHVCSIFIAASVSRAANACAAHASQGSADPSRRWASSSSIRNGMDARCTITM